MEEVSTRGREPNCIGVDAQPVNGVEWVPRDDLHSNDYNPNHVAPMEMELLKESILEDGWTQPIVCAPNNEIIDGFHRWTVSGSLEVFSMTDGLVPVVYVHRERGDQMMSTIRHNRARGQHAVLKMADIVRSLLDDHDYSKEMVQQLLGMEDEEVDRLYDASGMPNRAGEDEIGKGWVPE